MATIIGCGDRRSGIGQRKGSSGFAKDWQYYLNVQSESVA